MKERVSNILRACGLNIFGFCALSDTGELLPTRNKERIPVNAQTVITMLFPYRIPQTGKRNLSLYCIGRDYHSIILKKLESACIRLKKAFPASEFEPFCDNSPIREVAAAYQSGLGYLGQNGLIIHPKFGSYCFIGEIVTNMVLENYSKPLGGCLGCDACIKNCIGGALSKNEDGKIALLSRENCISYITQKKGELSAEQKEKIRRGGLVWGCDGCSLICPMNKDTLYSDMEEFYVSPMPYLTQETAYKASERAYGYKGEKILIRNLGIINGKADNNNGK